MAHQNSYPHNLINYILSYTNSKHISNMIKDRDYFRKKVSKQLTDKYYDEKVFPGEKKQNRRKSKSHKQLKFKF